MSAGTRVVGRRTTRSDRLVPLAYLVAALLLGVLILPSVLRPPRDQPTTSSGFSPDAPPDKNNQSSVFSSFQQASSGTPGGVTQTAGTAPPTTQPPAKIVPGACPYGFGNPPRQIESVYAPPCAPAFSGDNGGATAAGVNTTDVNVCFVMQLTGTVGNDGEMVGPPAPNDSANMRTYKVFRDYFNSRYQFYGRHLRFFYALPDSTKSGDDQERARGDKAADVDHCFAALQETSPASIDELTLRHIFTFTLAQTPESYFGSKDPYLWSFTPAGSQAVRLGTEYACKKLAGKPPSFTNDPNLSGAKQRKFGAIVYNLPQYANPGPQIKSLMAQCGVSVDPIVTYDLTGSGASTQGLASAITQMQVNNVTTVFYLGDLLSAVFFTQNAKSNNYFPEWFVPGFGGVDTGHIGRDYDQQEWSHAFGFSFYEIPKPDEETECYKAYHEIDPNNDPDSGMCTYMWGNMVQMFAAMQAAGPHLDIQTIKQAMVSQKHLPPDPPWHMAGGYDLNDHTYPDWASEIWWDPKATASDGQAGSYRFPRRGKRYTYGQWPTEDPPVFQNGPDVMALSP
ncbi:MAG: hypothetical protein E6G27_15570 [Actinobacteria bacterium]|nr:MAG: hypothetical protein E6G27_15570 [Actinomycetota bacterium]